MRALIGERPLTPTEKTRRVREKRHAQGLCWYCTQPIAPGSKGQCTDHLEQARLNYRVTAERGTWRPGSVGRPPLWAKPLPTRPATTQQTEAA